MSNSRIFQSHLVSSDLTTGDNLVLRIDGYYLYSVGSSIHPLAEINKNTKFGDILFPLLIADGTLEPFLQRSVFKIKTSLATGINLLTTIRTLKESAEDSNKSNEEIGVYNAYLLSKELSAFETLLAAELGLTDIYLVSKKRGYDTSDLINNGTVLFPDDLLLKVPDSKLDIEQGARCLAFELPTASGFHFHRANESVLHRYYDAVTGGKPRPAGRSIGDYLAELKKYGVGEAIVLSSLKDLKDLHRNPLIHPEHTLENIDQAIALLGIIQSVIVHMLKVIPLPPTATSILTSPVTP
jgi:hypothetical protein